MELFPSTLVRVVSQLRQFHPVLQFQNIRQNTSVNFCKDWKSEKIFDIFADKTKMMATTFDAFRNLEIETNKLYEYEVRMSANLEKRRKESKQMSNQKTEIGSKVKHYDKERRQSLATLAQEGGAKNSAVESVKKSKRNSVIVDAEIAGMTEADKKQLSQCHDLHQVFAKLFERQKETKKKSVEAEAASHQEMAMAMEELNQREVANSEAENQWKVSILVVKKEMLQLADNVSSCEVEILEVEEVDRQTIILLSKLEFLGMNAETSLQETNEKLQGLDAMLLTAQEGVDTQEEQIRASNSKIAALTIALTSKTKEYENMVQLFKQNNTKIGDLTMDWPSRMQLETLKAKLMDSENLEARLKEQDNHMEQMQQKMAIMQQENDALLATKCTLDAQMNVSEELNQTRICLLKEQGQIQAELAKKSVQLQEASSNIGKHNEANTKFQASKNHLQLNEEEHKQYAKELSNIDTLIGSLDMTNGHINTDILELEVQLKSASVDQVNEEDIVNLVMKIKQSKTELVNLEDKMSQIEDKFEGKRRFDSSLKLEIQNQHKQFYKPLSDQLKKKAKDADNIVKKAKSMDQKAKSLEQKVKRLQTSVEKKRHEKKTSTPPKNSFKSPIYSNQAPRSSSYGTSRFTVDQDKSSVTTTASGGRKKVDETVNRFFKCKKNTPGEKRVSFQTKTTTMSKKMRMETTSTTPKVSTPKVYSASRKSALKTPQSVNKKKLFAIDGYNLFDESPWIWLNPAYNETPTAISNSVNY